MTSPSPNVTVTKLMQLKADAVAYRERLSETDPAQFTTPAEVVAWIKSELGLNLAPMFESTVDAIHEDVIARVEDLADAVDEIIEETGDQLTEETSSQILAVFQQGRAICNLLAGYAKNLDAVTRQRLQKTIKSYQTAETAVREVVMAITMIPDDVEEEGGEAPEGEPEEWSEADIRSPDEGGPEDLTVEATAAGEGEG